MDPIVEYVAESDIAGWVPPVLGTPFWHIYCGIKGLTEVLLVVIQSPEEMDFIMKTLKFVSGQSAGESFFVDLDINKEQTDDSAAWKLAGLAQVDNKEFKESRSLLCALKNKKLSDPATLAVIYKILHAQGRSSFGDHTSLVTIKDKRATFTALGKKARDKLVA